MTIIDVPLNQIEVGERRRTDFGDIGALAKGIQRVGLLEPIIVDRNGKQDHYRLIAGERRLRAAQMLKWKAIPANLSEHLTDAQMRDIELEENDNRKSLTDRERTRTFASAKKVVESAQKAAEVIADQVRNPKPGPKTQGPSRREVAAAVAVDEKTLRNAQKQVTLAERYPFLQPWRQADVLKFEHHLRQLKPDEHTEFCDFLVRNYSPMPPRADQAIEVAEVMTAKTSQARATVYELSKSGDKRQRDLAATRARQRPPMPDARISFLNDAVTALQKALKPPYDTELEATELRAIEKRVVEVRLVIRSRYEQLKKEEERHVEADLR